jgi:hypothetical protein
MTYCHVEAIKGIAGSCILGKALYGTLRLEESGAVFTVGRMVLTETLWGIPCGM